MNSQEELAKASGGLGHDYDYGLAGAQAANGHYSDYGKLPNHPTFSEESFYHSDSYRGGQWTQDENGNDVFTPSPDMMNSGATKGLAAYFMEVEPNAKLNTPPPYRDIE